MQEQHPTASEPGDGRADRHNRAEPEAVGFTKQPDASSATAAQQASLFSTILPADCDLICASARARSFARGEMLYLEGYAVQQVFLMTSGFVKITQLSPGGTEAIMRFGKPGDALGLMGLFPQGTHRTTAQAFRPCQTLAWDAPAFEALVARFPVLYQNIVRILSADLTDLEVRFCELATEKVGPRVARQLLRMLKQMGRPVGGATEIAISRQDLAEATGTTLFTVSRLLSEWQERGLVAPRREGVTIFDLRSLHAVFEET